MERVRRKQEDRRQEAETRLLDAAVELVSAKGYDRFTLAEVGELAGFSRGLPAHYFGSKDKMLSLAAERIVASFRTRLEQRTTSDDGLTSISETLREIARRTAEAGAPTRALHIILGAAINNPGLAESVRRLNEVSIGWIAEALRRGIATGAIRPDIDVDAEAVMITAFHRGSASYKLVTPTFPIQAVTEIYIVELNRRLLIKAAPQPARRAAAKPAGKKATRPK